MAKSSDKLQLKIKELDDLISNSKYNKRTQHAIGLYKAQLARLKDKQETQQSKKGGMAGGYTIKKSGDATVVFVGFPSVGKSTLLNKITNASSDVGSYDFTTLNVVPGLLNYNHAKIQVLDVPGLIVGAATGKGKGREVLSAVRNADLIVLIVDINNLGQLSVLLSELNKAGVRVNQKKPNVKIIKTAKNGIKVSSAVKLTKLNIPLIKAILNEFKIINAGIIFREDISVDQLIDVIESNKKYASGLVVLNKIDTVDSELIDVRIKEINADIAISAEKDYNLEQLKSLIFKQLNIIRIFVKEPTKEPDMSEPVILLKGATIESICSKLHRDFITRFRFCRVWGKSAKFPGQKLSLKHVLKDKDIVEVHLL